MKALCLRLATTILGALLATSTFANEDIYIAYSEPLQNFRLDYEASGQTRIPGLGQARLIQFDAFGRRFDIRLYSNHALLGEEHRSSLGANIGIYRGHISGAVRSWVRFVIVDGLPRGMIWDGQEMYAVDTAADNGPPIIYRLDDLVIPPGMLSCSHLGPVSSGTGLLQAVVGEASTALAIGPGATSQIDMAVLADFEFTNANGSSAEADVIARMNIIDGIFSAQLGVQLNVNQLDSYPNNDDPFSDEADAGSLLDELADYRNATPEQNANGLTHLFTGRTLNSSTVGVAFTSAVCSRRFGAGLTQGTFNLTTDSLIAAHEIGHNFGAPHDGTSGSACEGEAQTFLMAPNINGSDQFSSCSITQMQAVVATANCISALPSTDVAVVPGMLPATELLGNSTTVTFTVDSVGTNTANDVVIDITIPASVTLDGVSAGAATCTSGAGSTSCAIASIAPGAGVTVTLDVTTISTGNAEFVASISAAIDANSNNNQALVQFTIDPAVDLVATAATAVEVGLNQSVTVRPIVENRSSISATDIIVTVTPDDGLSISAASWAPGTCSIIDGVVTCQAVMIAAQSNADVVLQMTGISEGDQSYVLSVTANETDRDSANNESNGVVTVSQAVVPAPAEGGGGALDWFLIVLLALMHAIKAAISFTNLFHRRSVR